MRFPLFFAFSIDGLWRWALRWNREFGSPAEAVESTRFPSGATIENFKNINKPNVLEMRLAVLVSTVFGVGLAPFAPGTFGSAAGVLLFFGMFRLPAALYLLTVLTLFALGVWAADRAEAAFGKKDDGRIVMDEVVGQLLTLAPLVLLGPLQLGKWQWAVLAVTGFVTFRVFDIGKPGPIRWAERTYSGGMGVMLDDVVAGLIGALVMGAVLWGLGWGPLG